MPPTGPKKPTTDPAARRKAARRYATADKQTRAVFTRLAELARHATGVASSAFVMVRGTSFDIDAHAGAPLSPPAPDDALITDVLNTRKVIAVSDAVADARFAAHAWVTGPPSARRLAGAPLVTPEGISIGVLVVADPKAGTIDTATRRHLATLAAVAMDELLLRSEKGRAARLTEVVSENQQRFRSVVEQTGDWMWETDNAGVIRYSSPGVRDMLGHAPDDVTGRPFDDFLIPAERDRLHADSTLQQKIAAGEPYALRLTFRHTSGAEVLAEVNAQPMKGPDGSVRGYRSLAHDVTANEQAEEALALALERAEQMAVAKTHFLSTVSHEIITPLSVIEMQSQMLREQIGELDAPQAEDLKAGIGFIEEALGQVRDLVSSVQNAHRLEADTSSLHVEPIEVLAFLQDLTSEFKTGVGMHHTFRVGGQRFEVETDARLLRMVIGNLITNAIKYSPPEAPLEVTVVEEEGVAHFRVRDHGIGIEEADLPRLFEPFFRGGNVGDVYGTGMGLSIVRQCVERLGGRFAVQSKPNAGSLFHVYIPCSLD